MFGAWDVVLEDTGIAEDVLDLIDTWKYIYD